jgi:hypothetical protein
MCHLADRCSLLHAGPRCVDENAAAAYFDPQSVDPHSVLTKGICGSYTGARTWMDGRSKSIPNRILQEMIRQHSSGNGLRYLGIAWPAAQAGASKVHRHSASLIQLSASEKRLPSGQSIPLTAAAKTRKEQSFPQPDSSLRP